VIPIKLDENRFIIEGELISEREAFDKRYDNSNQILILEQLKDESPVSAKVLNTALVESKKMSEKTLYNNLNKLIDKGKVIKVAEGLYQKQ